MAINYPLDAPTSSIGLESITLRQVNATVTSMSPFTYKQQVISHGGQRWEADVTIPSSLRDVAEDWAAFLAALKGQLGTFLLGDPNSVNPRGNATSCNITGDRGEESVAATVVGTLKAGDYIQLGAGSSARLHKVLQDRVGSGEIDLWPSLRSDYTNETAVLTNTRGLFRLASNVSEWSINNTNSYGISFSAVEVIT